MKSYLAYIWLLFVVVPPIICLANHQAENAAGASGDRAKLDTVVGTPQLKVMVKQDFESKANRGVMTCTFRESGDARERIGYLIVITHDIKDVKMASFPYDFLVENGRASCTQEVKYGSKAVVIKYSVDCDPLREPKESLEINGNSQKIALGRLIRIDMTGRDVHIEQVVIDERAKLKDVMKEFKTP